MKLRDHAIEFGQRTFIMGILNCTPDSFSDGGQFLDPILAVDHAHQMIRDGADIIDIGGESSRPGSIPISANEEIDRVLPIIEKISAETDAIISIDTYKSEVAKTAINAGAEIVNDITALRGDPEMAQTVATTSPALILMHMQGDPKTMQIQPNYQNVIEDITSFLEDRIAFAEQNGIDKKKIVIDPGIGFGKTISHNLEILRKLDHFKRLKKPILIGTSRKSFIGKILDLPVEDRLEGTAATVAWSIAHGAEIIRVHDVKQISRVAKMTDAICRV